jgi:hypothetical protein
MTLFSSKRAHEPWWINWDGNSWNFCLRLTKTISPVSLFGMHYIDRGNALYISESTPKRFGSGTILVTKLITFKLKINTSKLLCYHVQQCHGNKNSNHHHTLSNCFEGWCNLLLRVHQYGLIMLYKNGVKTCFLKSYIQGVKKRCRLSWLTNSAIVYEPKWGRWGGGRGLSKWVQLWTWSPNKLWRSISIFNLCLYLRRHEFWFFKCKHNKRWKKRDIFRTW